MSRDANMGCPRCKGELADTNLTADVYECEDCGQRLHQVAAKHADLLDDLRDGDDPALAQLADTILSFEGGSE